MTQLTPALLDLMEHEKAIDQGIASMLDMSWAWEQIKEGKKYRASGHSTFEAYCQERWGLTPQHVNRVIDAGQIMREIEQKSEPIGSLVPTHESQVRPLKALDDPDERAAAWEDAVNDADGNQPTAKQVADAVQRRQQPSPDIEDDDIDEPEPDALFEVEKRPPVTKPDLGGGMSHPARYSDALLPMFIELLERFGATVMSLLDPFAGTGRIHELQQADYITTGIELEPEWAELHTDTICASALAIPFADGHFDAIVTSPTYGNRLADSYNSKDPHLRRSYHFDLGRELSDDNSGAMQWGDQYRAFHENAWNEAARVLRPGGLFLLNIKDHVRDGERQPVAGWHVTALCRRGFTLLEHQDVETPQLKQGANSSLRFVEQIYVFAKDGKR